MSSVAPPLWSSHFNSCPACSGIRQFVIISLLFIFHLPLLSNAIVCPDASWVPSEKRCFKVLKFDPPTTPPPSFPFQSALSSSNLLLDSDSGSWVDGMHQCLKEGGTLATLHDAVDDRIARMITSNFPDSCWIGLRRYLLERPERGWIWVDEAKKLREKRDFLNWGEELKFVWKLLPPADKCGEIDRDGWGELPCWGVKSKLKCAVCATLPYEGLRSLPSAAYINSFDISQLWVHEAAADEDTGFTSTPRWEEIVRSSEGILKAPPVQAYVMQQNVLSQEENGDGEQYQGHLVNVRDEGHGMDEGFPLSGQSSESEKGESISDSEIEVVSGSSEFRPLGGEDLFGQGGESTSSPTAIRISSLEDTKRIGSIKQPSPVSSLDPTHLLVTEEDSTPGVSTSSDSTMNVGQTAISRPFFLRGVSPINAFSPIASSDDSAEAWEWLRQAPYQTDDGELVVELDDLEEEQQMLVGVMDNASDEGEEEIDVINGVLISDAKDAVGQNMGNGGPFIFFKKKRSLFRDWTPVLIVLGFVLLGVILCCGGIVGFCVHLRMKRGGKLKKEDDASGDGKGQRGGMRSNRGREEYETDVSSCSPSTQPGNHFDLGSSQNYGRNEEVGEVGEINEREDEGKRTQEGVRMETDAEGDFHAVSSSVQAAGEEAKNPMDEYRINNTTTKTEKIFQEPLDGKKENHINFFGIAPVCFRDEKIDPGVTYLLLCFRVSSSLRSTPKQRRLYSNGWADELRRHEAFNSVYVPSVA